MSKLNLLKIIALVTMVIDHVGLMLFPDVIAFRYIGRVSFPIFAFLLVEGFFYTKNALSYFKRLFAFGVISSIPYLFFNLQLSPSLSTINIFFTLSMGLLMIKSLDDFLKDWKVSNLVLFLLVFCSSCFIPYTYGFYGFVTILIFYFTRQNVITMFVCFYLLNEINEMFDVAYIIQSYSFYGVLLACLLKDSTFNIKVNKYFAYWFYPIHILILIGLRYLVYFS